MWLWFALIFNSLLAIIFLGLAIYGIYERGKTATCAALHRIRKGIDDVGSVYRYIFQSSGRKWRQRRRERRLRKERFRFLVNDLTRDLLTGAVRIWWIFLCAAIVISSQWLSLPHRASRWSTYYGWMVVTSSFVLLVTWIPLWLRKATGVAKALFTALMLFLSLAFLFVAYLRTNSDDLSLGYVLFALTYILVPIIMTIKLVLDNDTSPLIKLMAGLFGYLCSFTYMIWLVGLYAGGKPILSGTVAEHFVNVLSTGAKYALSYQPDSHKGLIPLVAYQIGFLFNSVAVGFFISYWASLLYADLQSRRQATQLGSQPTSQPVTAPAPDQPQGVSLALIPDKTGGCQGNIKGVITHKGHRYYYLPDSTRYEKVKAAYCFQTEREAQDAGFVRGG